jgi:hypothetical protein
MATGDGSHHLQTAVARSREAVAFVGKLRCPTIFRHRNGGTRLRWRSPCRVPCDMRRALSLVVLTLGFVACSGGSTSNTGNLVGVQCSWPANLNDAGAGGCQASRTHVDCHDPAGDTCSCASDGAQTCDCSGFVSGGPWTCEYTCAPNQYLVSCGSIGPSAGPPAGPPSGCTTLGANAGGVVSYCCPCE